MDLRDFKKLCDKIAGLWGEGAVAKEKTDALWTYCRPIPLGEAGQIISAMLEDGDKFFSPAVFAGRAVAAEKERALKQSMVTREKTRVQGCPHCQGGGQLVAYRRNDPTCCGFAFRCTFCVAASAIGLAPQIVSWMAEYAADLELGVERQDRMQRKGRQITDEAERSKTLTMATGGMSA